MFQAPGAFSGKLMEAEIQLCHDACSQTSEQAGGGEVTQEAALLNDGVTLSVLHHVCRSTRLPIMQDVPQLCV